MNLKQFVTSLFKDTDIETAATEVHQIGQSHADTLVDSYREGFFGRLTERLEGDAENFHAVIDVTDYSEWEWPDLQSEAKRLGYDGPRTREQIESWLAEL